MQPGWRLLGFQVQHRVCRWQSVQEVSASVPVRAQGLCPAPLLCTPHHTLIAPSSLQLWFESPFKLEVAAPAQEARDLGSRLSAVP